MHRREKFDEQIMSARAAPENGGAITPDKHLRGRGNKVYSMHLPGELQGR